MSWRERASRPTHHVHPPGAVRRADLHTVRNALSVQGGGPETRYWLFGLVLGVQVLSKAVFMAVWGHYAHRRGPYALFRIGAIVIVPSPALAVAPVTPVLVVLQVSSGLATAAFELGILFGMFCGTSMTPVRNERRGEVPVPSAPPRASSVRRSRGNFDRLGYATRRVRRAVCDRQVTAARTLPAFLRIGIEKERRSPVGDIAVEFRGLWHRRPAGGGSAFEPSGATRASSSAPAPEASRPVDQSRTTWSAP